MVDKLTQITNANQTDKSSLFASLSFFQSQMHMSTDGMLPAKVISFDRESNTAEVQPIIHFMTLDGQQKERDPLTQINVLSIGGGGFHISFPLKAGDLGWIFASDRDLTEFKKELASGAPNNGRMKSFTSGLFIPEVFRQYTINAVDSDAMVIQSTDSEARISISKEVIRITHPTLVEIDTPETVAKGNFTVEGNALVKQNMSVLGDFSAAEGTSAALPTGTKIGGVNVSTHGHEQNGDSGRTSGGMEP